MQIRGLCRLDRVDVVWCGCCTFLLHGPADALQGGFWLSVPIQRDHLGLLTRLSSGVAIQFRPEASSVVVSNSVSTMEPQHAPRVGASALAARQLPVEVAALPWPPAAAHQATL